MSQSKPPTRHFSKKNQSQQQPQPQQEQPLIMPFQGSGGGGKDVAGPTSALPPTTSTTHTTHTGIEKMLLQCNKMGLSALILFPSPSGRRIFADSFI
jgi:hypothetical protein